MSTRRIISVVTKAIIAISAFIGIILCITNALGFMGGASTLLFFTIQSNIWIGVTSIVGICLMFLNKDRSRLYTIFKLLFTVAITVTGVVYCFVLAPTIGSNAFNLQNTLLHVIVPVASVVDWFIADDARLLRGKDIFYVIIPEIYYLAFASICYIFNVEFAAGVNYPYFFLNWGSSVGAFGFDFTSGSIYFMGTFYWIIVILMFVFLIAYIYIAVNRRIRNKRINIELENESC